MQEEVENRSVTLAISTTKLTARTLKAAIVKYLQHRKQKHTRSGPVTPKGKQTVKELVGQNQGVANIEISDSNIKSFDRVARKYGIDYAVKKDRSVTPPRYLVFFKGRDADALNAALTEYTRNVLLREEKRPSVLQKLATLAALVKGRSTEKVRNKDKEITL